jgi:hypothetical protein
VLVTLAAAGRNPTDILIPTQAGTDGSGGDDDDDAAGGGTMQAMDDPPAKGSNVVPYWDGKENSLDIGEWYLTYGDVFKDQAGKGFIVIGPNIVDPNLSTGILKPLPTIPPVRVGTGAPQYKAYEYDDTDFRLMDSIYARRDLRANPMFYKVNIVNAIAKMLRTTPPLDSMNTKGQTVTLTEAEIEEIANRVADWYIRAVDEFLDSHSGAAPRQGTRNFWLDALGIQDEFNHPWCDDWTTRLLQSSSKFLEEKVLIGGKEVALNQLVVFERVQWHFGPFQHNYMLVKPCGHPVANPPSSDQVMVLFDPWIRIAPDVYIPNRHAWPGMNTGVR